MSLWDKLTGNDQRKRAEEERRRLEVARQMSLRKAQQSSNPRVAQQATQKLQNNGWQVQQKQAPSLRQNIENAVGTVGLGLGRSGIGTAQGISGMYDLMTPGKGTNRFSQSLDTRAKRFDQIQKDQNRSSIGYKSAQFLGDAGTFLAGGAVANAAIKGATKAPAVVKLANNKAVQTAFKPITKTNSLANKGINALSQKGPAGRITAVAARNAKMPGNIAETAVDTGIGVGQMASKGQQVRPQDVALQAAISTGFNVGLPGTAQGVKELFRAPSRTNIPLGVVRPEHMNAQDIADLRAWRGAMGTGQTMGNPDLAYNGKRAAQIAGVDYRDPDAMDKILKQRMLAEEAKAQRAEKVQNAVEKVKNIPKAIADWDKKQGQGGFVRNPLVKDDGTPRIGKSTPPVGKTAPTSSSSSSGNAPELSASSPRNYGQENGLQVQPTQKNQIKRVSNQKSSQGLAYSNGTPKTNTVKLNTDRLNTGGDVQRLSNDTTETINQLSNKDVEKVARGAGIDTKTHTDEQIRQKIAEQLNVRKDAVRYMNEAEIARKAGDLAGAERSMLKAAEAGRISRAQGTELAQQLQARRIIANELDTPQQRIFKLLDAAGINPEAYVNRLRNVDFNNRKEVVDAYRDLVPAKKAEWLDIVRYNSMLSSPLTQAVNIFGNAQNVAIIAPIEKTIKGVFDAIGGAFGKERKYAAGEGLSYAKGSVTNIKNATVNFVDALRGTGKYSNPDLEEYSIPLATKGVSGALYKGLSFPMRVLDGMDKFFRTLAEAGEESALNLRDKKGIKIKGDKQALMEGEAAYRVFQQELHKPGQGILAEASDSFASLVMSGRNSKNPIVSTISKFTVPFVKTINNINKQGMIEYSPLGVVNMIGNDDKVTALTRATMGTAVFGVSSLLLGSGNMTWAEPRDPDERARFRAEGKQPYAIKVGGKWINFSKLTPAVAFPMAMTAALDDAMKEKKLDQGSVDAILEAVSKYGNFLADQSYAKSVGDTLGAIGGDKEAVANMVSNNIQQLVPFRALTGWIARMSDDLERKVDTSKGYFDQQVQSLMQQYPGLRQNTPTRDYKGTPIEANNQVFNAFSPVRVTNDRGVDPLDAELDATKAPEKDPLLTKSQSNEVIKNSQRRTVELQKKMIDSDEYKNMASEDRKKILDAISRDISVVEKIKYQAENNVGEYAPGYTGKKTTLTANQKKLASGETPDYLTPIKEKNAKDSILSKYSQEVQDFSKLSNAEKNEYFKRDPVKAKELYDQAKLMDAELGKKTSTSSKTTKKTSSKKSTKKKSSKTAKRGALPNWKNISPSKGLVNTRVSSVKFAPVKKPVYKGKKVVRKIA